MVVVCKPCQQRLKHPRRRRKTVQEENGRSVFRSRFSVEDGNSVYLYCPIKSRVLHETFLSLRHHRDQPCDAGNLQSSGPTEQCLKDATFRPWCEIVHQCSLSFPIYFVVKLCIVKTPVNCALPRIIRAYASAAFSAGT